jgi:DNA-binding GntR family transcriptional regulator
VDVVQADPDQAGQLHVGEGDDLLSVKVLGQGSGLPLAYYESVLPQRVAERLPTDPPWGARATYQVAAEAMGPGELIVAQEFDSIAIPREMAQILRVRTNGPGFKVISVFMLKDDPIELRTAWYPGSRYRFRVTRRVHS